MCDLPLLTSDVMGVLGLVDLSHLNYTLRLFLKEFATCWLITS